MNTQTKILIARTLSKTLKAARFCLGQTQSEVTCTRRGIHWKLDLNEGIDLALYLFGRFERDTSIALEKLLKPGSVALDIGANVGAHALPMAKRVGKTGKVFAIEPTDWAFHKLETNLSLNPDLSSTLVPFKMLLTDALGSKKDHFYSSWNVNQGEHPLHGGTLQNATNARAMTLDELVGELKLERLDLIKLDVDGFEFKILKAAWNTIQRFHPVIVLELTRYTLEEHGDSLEAFIQLFKDLGYTLRSEKTLKPLPLDSKQLLELISPTGGINAIAIKKA